jgi:peptidyl-dipeptidase Dcp
MKHFLLLLAICLVVSSCAKEPKNPLLGEFNTPFGVPPFDQIQENHYLPAFNEGIRQQKEEIEAIVAQEEPASFQNSVQKLEKSGSLLKRVNAIFSNLRSAHTNEQLQAIAKDVAPLLSKQMDDIFMDTRLFQRIRAVYEQKGTLELTTEDQALLDRWYRDFVRGGAELDQQSKNKLRKINERLSLLSVRFGENLLDENNGNELDNNQIVAEIVQLRSAKAQLLSYPTFAELCLKSAWRKNPPASTSS